MVFQVLRTYTIRSREVNNQFVDPLMNKFRMNFIESKVKNLPISSVKETKLLNFLINYTFLVGRVDACHPHSCTYIERYRIVTVVFRESEPEIEAFRNKIVDQMRKRNDGDCLTKM